MRLTRGYAYLLALPLLVACGAKDASDAPAETVEAPSRLVADSAGNAEVRLDTGEVRRLGLAEAQLQAAKWESREELTGELVPDPARSTTVRSAVAGRLESAAWPDFGATIVAGAEVGVVGDARAITAARSGRVSAVLAQPGELVQAGQALLELADLDHPVARLVWMQDAAPSPPRDVLVQAEGSRGVSARLIGPAAEADPVTRRAAFLYRLSHGWNGARPGVPVIGSFAASSPAAVGVRVPADAIVQWDGMAWAYVATAPGRFARRRIDTARPLEDGWFVTSGVAVGDRVVVRGAQALLSEEFRARINVGDESDK